MSISQMISFIFIFGIKYFIMEQNIIKGMSTSPVYEEGDCYSLVNMRHKQGALIPVPKRMIERELDRKYDLLFIHQINELERLIGVVVTNDKSVIYYIKADDSTIISEVDDVIVGIEQTGFLLVFVGKDDVYYARANKELDKDDYIYVGMLPDLPIIQFRTRYNSAVDVSLKWAGLLEGWNDNFLERAKAALYKGRDILRSENKTGAYMFSDFFWIRYAYRLYDGSVVKASAPILVASPYRYTPGTFYFNYKTINMLGETKVIDMVTSYGFGVIGLLPDDGPLLDDMWKDFIVDIDIFVSKPIGAANIEAVIDNIKKSNYKPTESFSNISRLGEVEPAKIADMCMKESTLYHLKTINPYTDDYKELDAKDKRKYFLLADDKDDGRKYESIIMQEEMSGIGSSTHKIGANVSYGYNKRLHIADTKTTLFDGYPIGMERFDFLVIEKDIHNWEPRTTITDNITQPKEFNYYVTGYGLRRGYNGISYSGFTTPPKEGLMGYLAKIEIDTAAGREYVYKFSKTNNRIYLSAVVSYPDLRAKHITLFALYDNDDKVYEVFSHGLNQEYNMGISYYINLDRMFNYEENENVFIVDHGIAPITWYNKEGDKVSTEYTKKSLLELLDRYNKTKVVIREPNKIKVSEVDNPMAFSNASTYQVSNGTILNIATNAMRVSEGQFGQYPLYVFTTKGIYAMNVGGAEAVYTTVHAPISFDIPIARHLCSTNNGVAFVSERGIKFITGGQQVDLLTSAIETSNIDMNLELPVGLDKQFLIIQDKEDFLDTLYKIDALAFDAVENEIVISIRDTDFNYVINLSNGTLWLSEENFHTVVKNSYPNLLVVNNTDLINYKDKATNMAKVNFQLRPLAFGASGIKQLPRAILRGTFNVAKDFCFGCMSSQDNENFQNVRIGIAKPGSYASLDYGLMMGNKANMYSYFGSGWLLDTTRIIKIDSIVYREFDSDKMR